MSFNRIAWMAVIALASVGGAIACGPFFPWQLLDSRTETLGGPVALGFDSELSRLVSPPRDGLTAVEDHSETPPPVPEVVRVERAEAASGAWKDLLPDDVKPPLDPGKYLERLDLAREAHDGKAALEAGAGLPVPVVEYIAGAVDYYDNRLQESAAHFAAIDRLPPPQRRLRTVAANFMLGRLHEEQGEFAEAHAAFQAVRARAKEGAPDPMGLAVASLGEEARLDLIDAGLIRSPWPYTPPDWDDAKSARLIETAIELYLDQSARGSRTGRISLRNVAFWLTDSDRTDKPVLAATIGSPLVRRLLVAYVISRDGRNTWDEDLDSDDVAIRVIDAVLAQPAPAEGDDVDRLAALAYLTGHYSEAEKLLAPTDRPLGLWVRAKLALRRGDRAAAVRDWMAALGAIAGDSKGGAALDASAKLRLRGEAAVIQLAQGDYRQSLQLLFPVAKSYWGDVAYIAERVLTVDELKSFVDSLPPAPPTAPPKTDDDWTLVNNPTDALRDLLARRLVRAGREREALPYFSTAANSPRAFTPDDYHPSAEDARAYVAALEASQPTSMWRSVSRAEALFKLAVLTRRRGMEVMGTEGPPDLAALAGDFDVGVGQPAIPSPLAGNTEEAKKAEAALLGPDEAQRFAASAPKPDVRFHYRVIATDRALAAADLLPQRSQAYAATLCWATKFAKDSLNQARVEAIYKRYVATGAFQPWAKAFGGTCPQPDFDQARDYWLRRIALWFERGANLAQRRPALFAGLIIAAGIVLIGGVWLARRRWHPAG